MNGQQGDGIGIEVGMSALRGIRLAHDAPGLVVAAAEEPIDRDDEEGLTEAFERLAARLGATPSIAARLAWCPPGTTVHSVDVSGKRFSELEPAREAMSGIRRQATTIVDAGARRWLVAVSWDHRGATRLVELAGRAGLTVGGCDPAPLALARMLPLAPTIVRRSEERVSWTMVAADGTPVAAAAVADGKRRRLALIGEALAPSELDVLRQVGDDPAGLELAIADLARGRVDGRRSADVSLLLSGAPYPAYPADDARAAARQCVALGAAVAAAGLAGRVREVALVGVDDGGGRRPWVIERLPDEPAAVSPRVSWWRRLLAWVRRWRVGGRR